MPAKKKQLTKATKATAKKAEPKKKLTKAQQKAEEKQKKATTKATKKSAVAAAEPKQSKSAAKKQTKKAAKEQPAKVEVGKKRKNIKSEDEPVKATKKVNKATTVSTAQPETKMVKQIVKGGAAVDENCPIKNQVRVFQNYDAKLNQSNMDRNNNKFYIIQVLQDEKNPSQFYFWSRWGRVGVVGQNILKPMNQGGAISEYEKKLRQKTVSGEYIKLDIVTGNEDEEEEKPQKKPAPKAETKKSQAKVKKSKTSEQMDQRLKDLLNLIFDMKMISNQMKEIGYDAKKCPLGKLANSTILKGYDVLNKLLDAVQKKEGNSVYSKLSSEFFTLIPHDFGFQKMSNFILDTEQKVRDKFTMLQSLTDMRIATKLIEEGVGDDEDIYIANYRKLKAEVQPLDKSSKDWQIINEYFNNTKEGCNLKVLDIFTIDRDGEAQKYNDKMLNKLLLWHGSGIGNFVGIISQGMRITPGAGGLFGRGLYFADMIAKSQCYCSAENNTAMAVLCEVAMGNMNEKMNFDCQAHDLPKGKDSVKGCARIAPPMNKYVKMPSLKDVQVPIAKPEKFKGNIGHNEYLVYTEKQSRLRYLIKFEKKGYGFY